MTDIFENFRDQIFKEYQLDPACYLTVPSLAFDAALKLTGQELELITDPNIYNFLEKGIRGGISMVVKRFAEANNKYLKNYNSEKETSYLVYLDANNLYGVAMSFPLPISDFRFSDSSFEKLQTEWEEKDCIVDCDIHCPEELKEKFKDFPLCPQKENGKLLNTLHPKKNYITHSRYLKNCIEKGYILDRVNKTLHFTSKPWLKPYIEKNSILRSKAVSKFERDLWKLMNNAVYGKQMENMRNRINILFEYKEGLKKQFSKPTFKNILALGEDKFLLEMTKVSATLNKPIYGGLTILDFSKIVMNNFFYDYLQKKFGDNFELLYTDTDSFIIQVYTKDFYKDIEPDIDEYFDTSEYPKKHSLYTEKNKKVLGKFKDELKSIPIERFVALRSKLYCYETADGKFKCRSKGCTQQSMRDIGMEDFLKSLNGEIIYTEMKSIRSKNHELYIEKFEKKALDGNDDKRQILEDGIHTLPWGY